MLTRSRSEACLSDLLFDRLLVGELSPQAVREAGAHISSCEVCSARHAELEAEKERFLLEAPAFAAPPGRRRVQRWTAVAGLGMAAAAVLALSVSGLQRPSVSLPVHSAALVTDGSRSKGGSSLGYYVARGTLAVRGDADQHLAPGDRLQFYYSATQSGYFALLSVDGAGHASVYFPAMPTATAIAPGVEVPLANSVILDSTLGDEVVYGLFCNAPIALGPVRDRLEADSRQAPSVDGCRVEQVRFSKRMAP